MSVIFTELELEFVICVVRHNDLWQQFEDIPRTLHKFAFFIGWFCRCCTDMSMSVIWGALVTLQAGESGSRLALV